MSNRNSNQPFLVEVTETFTKRIIVWAESEEDAFWEAENLFNENVVDAINEEDGNYPDFSHNCDVIGNAYKLLGGSNGYPEYHIHDMEERKKVLANLELLVYCLWKKEVSKNKNMQTDIGDDMTDLAHIKLPAHEVRGEDGATYSVHAEVNAEDNTITVFIDATAASIMHADSTTSINRLLEYDGLDTIYKLSDAAWAVFNGKANTIPEEYID